MPVGKAVIEGQKELWHSQRRGEQEGAAGAQHWGSETQKRSSGRVLQAAADLASPTLLCFPLPAPTLSVSVTDLPLSPSSPWGGLSQRWGNPQCHPNKSCLCCLSQCSPPSQASSVQRNPPCPPTLCLHHLLLLCTMTCFLWGLFAVFSQT